MESNEPHVGSGEPSIINDSPEAADANYFDEQTDSSPSISDPDENEDDDQLYVWGSTVDGQLGLGGIEDHHVMLPRSVTSAVAHNVKHIVCGEHHTLLLTLDGKVYSCGNNDFCQLGHGKSRTRFGQVNGLESQHVVHVACGSQHSLAVNEWGQTFTWGSNQCGQLGTEEGYDVCQPAPKIVKSLATQHVIQVCCGSKHCLALTNDGSLYSWGSNEFGQCGHGTGGPDNKYPVPKLISFFSGLPIANIACGWYHSFAVSKSGAIYGWGRNNFGQLGLNHQLIQYLPKHLTTMRTLGVKYIACGEDFSVFLTKDGGVFTCGAGMYGQLGHGTFINEVLPRKVMELMGSIVTQIACGRRHTLAYIPSRSRVYAFGLGGAGQLGNRLAKCSSTPQVVLGPWVSSAEIVEHSSPKKEYAVNRIFAGGDQCFVTVCPKESGTPSSDYRVLPPETQIWTIKEENLLQCEKLPVDCSVDQDLLTYLEVVMNSLACLNGSFLREGHFCCSIKNHGIDMNAASKCFSIIGRVEHPSILSTIICSIVSVVETLPAAPMDIEVLRAFITLPLYHEFLNPKNAMDLQVPFGYRFLNVISTIEDWYKELSSEYFENLILIFKNVFVEKLKNRRFPPEVQTEPMLFVPLEVLAKLNELNKKIAEGEEEGSSFKVPCHTFYITEIKDHVDLRGDFIMWVQHPQRRKYFCNYPFVFDPEAKTAILQVDQMMQMQEAVNSAVTSNMFQMFLSPTANMNHFLELHVSRNTIVEDTIRELSMYSSTDLKKPLKVRFLGEDAEDAGGVKKEFFLLVLKKILDPKYGMFQYYDESRTIWFRQDSFEDKAMFFLIGVLCGLAIYNFTIINLPFPLALYKKLLNEPVGLPDVKGLSPSVYRSMIELLEYEDDDFEEVFDLRFEMMRDMYGEIKVVPLKENGSNIPVTQLNKYEFVNLYVDMLLNKSVEQQFVAFKNGFFQVCRGRVLQLFQALELMSVVTGSEDYDWYQLENNTEYKNGYSSGDPTIRLFWEVFHELSLEEKKKFLLFLTGSDRVPIQGMKAMRIIIQPTDDERYLPVAHTCFNLLDLPKYKTKERLRYKLLQAIQQTHGFSLV